MAIKSTGIPVDEQETVVQVDRRADTARIYTTDTRDMNKLDKIYPRVEEHHCEGKIVAVEYEVPRRCISYRSLAKKKTDTKAKS